MITVFEILNVLKTTEIPVAPFNNYDPAYVVEHTDAGFTFKSNENMWKINKVEYASTGNLNLQFLIEGVVTDDYGNQYPAKTFKNISVVKNGELKLQYLQLTKDKEKQAKLPVQIKNNILDLSKFSLTDKTTVNINDVLNEQLLDFIQKLHKPSTPKPVLTVEEERLAKGGLKNGIFTKPVAKQVCVEENRPITIKFDGLSSKTTKLAKLLKEKTENTIIRTSNVNELKYLMQVFHMNVPKTTVELNIIGINITGTIEF